MSAVLVLRLAGPMQSWGLDSRFTRRSTEAFPTKSALVGLLGAAQGRRRSDPIEDLAELSVAVRVDQPGQLLHDFHTAHRGDTSMPLSHRFYRADAAFGAFIEGPDDMIDALAKAIVRPVFPLYLGRRSCPPTLPLRLAVREGKAWDAVRETPWMASVYYQKKQRHDHFVRTRVVADLGIIPPEVEKTSQQTLQDMPISFDSENRKYSLRTVEETYVDMENPQYVETKPQAHPGLVHDPMEVL
ncbi:CRISPR system Cascade subunit CasD [uncultured Actinomyces sp.]|nr:CRISPR system Cascade subunit CasD [uncultured Actinomyces sp.]